MLTQSENILSVDVTLFNSALFYCAGKPVDMWAVGVILFILLAGYFPFDGTDEEVRELTLSGQYEFTPEHFSHISEEAKELVRGLLTTDAEQRLTAQQALSHPWVSSFYYYIALTSH